MIKVVTVTCLDLKVVGLVKLKYFKQNFNVVIIIRFVIIYIKYVLSINLYFNVLFMRNFNLVVKKI